ncbi:MAG: MFS transporter [Thermoplasmata archaeon]|nr:MAG: MFS transporter [Thermoplasmata archaeon]
MASRVGEFFKDFRGFEPDAKKLIYASFLSAVGDATLWFLLTLYVNHLEYSRSEIGTLIFIMSIFQVLPLLPAGYLGDRFGRRKMIFLGICIYSAGIWLLIQANTLSEFYVGAAVWGFGHALYIPAFMSFLSEKTEMKRCKFLFGFQMFASMLASASAVLFYGFMPEALSNFFGVTVQNGYRLVFFIGLAFTLYQLVPIVLTKKTSFEEKDGPIEDVQKDNDKPELPKLTLVKLCIPMALFGLGAGLIVPFFQVWFQWRFDTRVEDIGILWSVTQYIWAFSYLVMPNIAEKRGSVRAITTVQVAAIIALLGIPVSPNFLFVTIPYMTRMILMNMTWPVSQSYSLSQMPDEHRSFTLSSVNFSFNGTRALTPLIAGYLFEMNLQLPFFITAGLYVVGTAAFYIFFRKKDDVVSEKEPKERMDNQKP